NAYRVHRHPGGGTVPIPQTKQSVSAARSFPSLPRLSGTIGWNPLKMCVGGLPGTRFRSATDARLNCHRAAAAVSYRSTAKVRPWPVATQGTLSMSDPLLFVGLDVGGTTMKAGVVEDSGRVRGTATLPTEPQLGQEFGLDQMCRTIR